MTAVVSLVEAGGPTAGRLAAALAPLGIASALVASGAARAGLPLLTMALALRWGYGRRRSGAGRARRRAGSARVEAFRRAAAAPTTPAGRANPATAEDAPRRISIEFDLALRDERERARAVAAMQQCLRSLVWNRGAHRPAVVVTETGDATCTVRAYAWAGPTSDPLRCRNILNHRLLADLHTAGFGPATPTLPARPPSPCTAPDRTPLRSPMSLVPASR